MKDIVEIPESSADIQQKRKKKRGGLKFSGSKQRRRMALRRKESMSQSECDGTREVRDLVGNAEPTPFQLRCIRRATNLESVSEVDEYDKVEQDCEKTIDEVFSTAPKYCTSQTDSHHAENDDEEQGVDSDDLVIFDTRDALTQSIET